MDLHSRWTHRWRNSKTDSFESPIHGLGVVANANIKKDEVVAIRDISKGEEVFLDYGFMETDFESFECGCDSSACRGKVTPDDWKDKDLQDRFGDYLSPYLKVKFS